jgi:predicted CXXCH cytochrome family protein
MAMLIPHSNMFACKFLSGAALLLAFGICAVPAHAGKHPVPLEKGVTSQKCLECHENKTKGASVHSAMAKGCLACHEVRVTSDVTRTKLTSATPTKLCLQCHANKNAAQLEGKVHSPAVRDCLKCHDAHESANEKQLLRPTSGDKGQNLCLDCHTTGLQVPEKGSRHAALDMGCNTCHLTHKTGDPGKDEFRYHLTKASPGLCLDCHDVKEEALQKAHQNQPFATADCLSCHDPHQSARPKLMQKFVHLPFGDKQCDTCHQPAKDGKIVLTQASAKPVCVSCHSDKAEQIEKAKVQHPGAAGDCTDCHNPHASKSPGLPKTNAVNICLGCHTEQAEQRKKKTLHQPVFEQGCAICHEPHGGNNTHLLRASTPNALCLECHGPDARPKQVEGEPLVAIFDGQVKLPENYFARVIQLPIKYGLGHPVDHHPVVDQMQPEDATKVRVGINCLTCHQPHASAQPDLLVKDQANNLAFCATCHKGMGPGQ